jgi:hypothetical protein
VVARNSEGTVQIAARGGVVLANGGFEWDSNLVRRLHGEPATLRSLHR